MELIVFVLASAMMLIGAFGVITRRNPVHAALSLVLTLFGVAVHFVALEAYFLAAVQIIVYAGAIVVLFLFVIMLLGVDKAEDLQTEPLVAQRWLAGVPASVCWVCLSSPYHAGQKCSPHAQKVLQRRRKVLLVMPTSNNWPARSLVTM